MDLIKIDIALLGFNAGFVIAFLIYFQVHRLMKKHIAFLNETVNLYEKSNSIWKNRYEMKCVDCKNWMDKWKLERMFQIHAEKKQFDVLHPHDGGPDCND